MLKSSLLLVAAQLASLASAVTLRIQFLPSNALPNPNALSASTHATLTSGTAPPVNAIIRRGGYIELTNVTTTGSHVLDIYSHEYTFAPCRIDIAPPSPNSAVTENIITGAYETYRGVQWSDHGPILSTLLPSTSLTVNAKVLARKQFYEERPGFSPLNLLKNPMILMGVVALGITFGMPKLMENMDPEMKAEYEEMQKSGPMGSIGKALQGGGGGGGKASDFDLAGFLAGSQTSKSTGTESGGNSIRERKR